MYRQIFRLLKRHPGRCWDEFISLGSFFHPHKNLEFQNQRSTFQPFVNSLICAREFSKSRDKKKEKNKKVRFDENELKEYFDVEKLLQDLKWPVDKFREDLIKFTSLRTNTSVFQELKVEFEGEEYAIQDLAEVSKKGSQFCILDFGSFPGAIPSAIKTLNESELNLNVQQEGNKVIVPLPKVTREHRELLARKSKLFFNKCKDSVRDVQMKYIKSLGKLEKLPNEAKFRLTDQLTALGNSQIKVAEGLLKEKQNDLLQDD